MAWLQAPQAASEPCVLTSLLEVGLALLRAGGMSHLNRAGGLKGSRSSLEALGPGTDSV